MVSKGILLYGNLMNSLGTTPEGSNPDDRAIPKSWHHLYHLNGLTLLSVTADRVQKTLNERYTAYLWVRHTRVLRLKRMRIRDSIRGLALLKPGAIGPELGVINLLWDG